MTEKASRELHQVFLVNLVFEYFTFLLNDGDERERMSFFVVESEEKLLHKFSLEVFLLPLEASCNPTF